jgi:mannose-1-phosphate guanylyltransferase/mannose-6-phosphate isomerase
MYGVVLAGGSGTRFWPYSREMYPKQLLKIFGDQTLIQATLSRIAPIISSDGVYIVTNPQQGEQIQFQLPPATKGPFFITEPMGRNTAAAIGLAAVVLSKRDPEGVMAVLSADHFIQDREAFLEALLLGNSLAKKGYLVTVGAKPTRPETAYGYVQKGEPLPDGHGGSRVARFVEKPDMQTAETYIKSDDFFWNAGFFIWKASSILEEIFKFMPELASGLTKIKEVLGTEREEEVLKEVYPALPSISIDYGVLEKSDRLAVIPAEMGWEDVGSWSALDEVLPKDEQGNIFTGNVVNIGCSNSIVYANNRVVAAVGLKNMVVADTEDATLVCSKENAQDVKKVVEALKKRTGEEHHLVHRTVFRPWGSFTVLEEGATFKIKRILVKPKARLSLQSHTKRAEHWVVVAGTARVTCGESVYNIGTNQGTFVPMGVRHRLENPGDEMLQIIEVQCGAYLGEDDITRYSDDFGRVANKTEAKR